MTRARHIPTGQEGTLIDSGGDLVVIEHSAHVSTQCLREEVEAMPPPPALPQSVIDLGFFSPDNIA